MRKLIYLCFLVVQASFQQLSALIMESPNLELFEKIVQSSDENCLVVLDVDNTIICPHDLIQKASAEAIRKKLIQNVMQNPTILSSEKYTSDYFYLLSQLLIKTSYAFVDPKILPLIESLQDRGVKTIACTNIWTGEIGVIPSLEDWRIQSLQELGIDFSKAFPHTSFMRLVEFEYQGKAPIFKQGILSANKVPKGKVLMAFLQAIQWQPKCVIFLDDSLDYLLTVEEALQETGIEFIGLYYTAAVNQMFLVDEKLAEYQYLHLAQKGIWLNDQEAREHMQTREEETLTSR